LVLKRFSKHKRKFSKLRYVFKKYWSNSSILAIWGENSFGLEQTKEISNIPRFLGGFKRALYFSRFFPKRTVQI